jgi:hypothetical protein
LFVGETLVEPLRWFDEGFLFLPTNAASFTSSFHPGKKTRHPEPERHRRLHVQYLAPAKNSVILSLSKDQTRIASHPTGPFSFNPRENPLSAPSATGQITPLIHPPAAKKSFAQFRFRQKLGA